MPIPAIDAPQLVIGFAAETHDLLKHASEKIIRKKCDWLVANEVSESKGFNEDDNEVVLLRKTANGEVVSQQWPRQSKTAIARQLTDEIVSNLS